MGVVYYKLKSKYEGDVTVDRSLRCDEVDGNFHFLRGFDINEIGLDDETGELVLSRVNGDELRVSMDEVMDGVQMSFDADTGVLRIGDNEVSGFTKDVYVNVCVDSTLRGNGDRANPLRISETEKTGTFAAVDEYMDLSEDDETLTSELAEEKRLPKGYRIVTKENISKLGLLYSYDNAKLIQHALNDASSQWRIPSKNDWDKMLNSIEPKQDGCSGTNETSSHSSDESNVWLGEVAGKKLKDVNVWNNSDEDAAGTDNYGFSVLPVGYIEDSGAVVNIRKYAAFWSSSMEDAKEDMYIKRFDDDSAKVYQSTWDPQKKLSLRLVKDYDGSNFLESEYIEGINLTVPCVLMPDSNTIWTKVNISAKQFYGVTSEYWDNFTEEEKESLNGKVYLLNEWDGEKWIKRQLLDGQSMVFRTYDDPEKGELHYHEYVVIKVDDKFELRDTVSVIEDEFEEELEAIRSNISELNENLSAETEARTAVDYELGQRIQDETDRATNAETNLNNLVNEEHDRALSAETVLHQEIIDAEEKLNSKIEAEETRATEAEDALNLKIDGEEARAISAETGLHSEIEAETTRATNSEAELHNEISSETARAMSAETELAAELIAETERATSSESSLHEEIVAETSRATNAESALHAEVGAETARATDAEAELDEKIESETERATNAETEIRSGMASAETGIRQDLNDEIQRAENAEAALAESIANEKSERKYNDTEILNLISSETAERMVEDDTLRQTILSVEQASIERDFQLTATTTTIQQDLQNEIQRAENAEAELDAKINTEAFRAQSAETVLSNSLNSEITRSTQKDNELNAAILDEQSRAEVAEESLHDEITTVKESAGLDSNGNYAPNGNANYISQATTLADADNKLDAALKLEEIERKGIHIVKVTEVLPVNVKEAYDLVNKNGVRIENSERILIYKDSALVNVYLGTTGDELVDYDHPDIVPGSGDTAICFVYQMSNGQYRLIKVDVEEFLQETEFEDGLSVEHGVVKVKVDELSDEYLTVSANGVRLSGVKSAITTENQRAVAVETQLTTNLNNEIVRAQSADTALQTALNAEASARQIAEQTLENSISAEQTARENADSILTNAVNTLNGPYNQTGSVKKTVIDSVIGTFVTSITPEQAKDQSLARIIEGTGRFYVSNNSIDIKYGNTNVSAALDSADTRLTALESSSSSADTRIAELEAALAAANQRITDLENNLETTMRDFMLGFIKGYDNQISVVRCDSSGNPTQITDETKFIKIKFAPDAIFMAD